MKPLRMLACCLGSLWAGVVLADDTLDKLLEAVRVEASADGQRHAQREQEFLSRRNEQAKLLRQAEKAVDEAESRVKKQREELSKLAETITERKAELQERSGDLQGVAAALRDAATSALEQFSSSLVSLDDPERLSRIRALTQVSDVPGPEDLEALWLALQEEATALGHIRSLRLPVAGADGEVDAQDLRRYGGFALRNADGAYLHWRGGGAVPEVIARQPKPGLAERATGMHAEGLIIDPTRGMLLGLQESRPGLRERVAQGGVIGFIILGLGALGLLLGFVQLLYLTLVGGRVSRQLKQPELPRKDNPLGRVLAVQADFAGRDFSSLELAADEAVMRELPKLERLQDTVRLLAGVAPLLGLLGTVTGMIETFQAITLFGTGDPKLMAGGISQALMTTVLGLVVAVPLLFLHSLIVARSRSIVQRLDQQSAGLLAGLSEAREVRA